MGKEFFPYIIEIKKADMAAQSDYKLDERQDQLVALEKKYEEIVNYKKMQAWSLKLC